MKLDDTRHTAAHSRPTQQLGLSSRMESGGSWRCLTEDQCHTTRLGVRRAGTSLSRAPCHLYSCVFLDELSLLVTLMPKCSGTPGAGPEKPADQWGQGVRAAGAPAGSSAWWVGVHWLGSGAGGYPGGSSRGSTKQEGPTRRGRSLLAMLPFACLFFRVRNSGPDHPERL